MRLGEIQLLQRNKYYKKQCITKQWVLFLKPLSYVAQFVSF